MVKKITSRQVAQFQKLAGDALTSLNLTKEGAQLVLASKAFQARFRQLVVELSKEFYVLLSDDEAVRWLVKHAKTSKVEARQIVNGFRQKARADGVADTVHIHAECQSGCVFKRDMAQMGPTWEDFKYLQGWNFLDPPTEHCLVSWVPVPLVGSTEKNVDEQTEKVSTFKSEAGLPAWYDISFGSINHVSGMTLAHFKAVGVNPFNGLVVRTDTCPADGIRLKLYWHGGRLCCDGWYWVVALNSVLAVFAVGVVKALGQ